ncbi:MAG: hypothetical protein PVJ32_05015 [Anaerolineales bacterium]
MAACAPAAISPEQDQLATSVAATLTAVHIQLLPTLPPSATPVPSITPTLTLTPTITPTPGPTPLPPDDPRRGLDLSAPDYVDAFSVAHTWFYDYRDDRVEIFRVENSLSCTDKRTDHIITWSTTARQDADVFVEITAEIGPCQGKDGYGLGLRVGGDQYDRGYTVEFSCDGHFRMRKFIDVSTPPVTLVDWTHSAAIITGSDASNRLGFAAKGANLYALANGELIGQAQDTGYTYGTYGLFASAAETAGLTVTFDNFRLWQLTP